MPESLTVSMRAGGIAFLRRPASATAEIHQQHVVGAVAQSSALATGELGSKPGSTRCAGSCAARAAPSAPIGIRMMILIREDTPASVCTVHNACCSSGRLLRRLCFPGP